jgi:hypothetical protein
MVESKTARWKHRKECPLRMRKRRKLAINILSLQSSIYVVLGNPSTDLSTGHAHTWVFRYGWILGFSSTTRPDYYTRTLQVHHVANRWHNLMRMWSRIFQCRVNGPKISWTLLSDEYPLWICSIHHTTYLCRSDIEMNHIRSAAHGQLNQWQLTGKYQSTENQYDWFAQSYRFSVDYQLSPELVALVQHTLGLLIHIVIHTSTKPFCKSKIPLPPFAKTKWNSQTNIDNFHSFSRSCASITPSETYTFTV